MDPNELGILRDADAVDLSLLDYIDFMHRENWKSYQEPSCFKRVGNYLDEL